MLLLVVLLLLLLLLLRLSVLFVFSFTVCGGKEGSGAPPLLLPRTVFS